MTLLTQQDESYSPHYEPVQRAELEWIHERRKAAGGIPGHAPLIGLALSGGGIRSASFNLGVLQALEHHGLLSRIDYLSSVSGGGYIASFLAWVRTRSQGDLAQRLTLEKSAGIALSIAGIGVLVGWTPKPMTGAELLACSFSLAACACYGFSSVYTKIRLSTAPPAALSTASCLVAAGAMAPLTPWTGLAGPVPASAWLAIAALGIVCTGFAFILYYRLIADLGPVRATTVTLLIPVFGILWGVVFLGEPLTPGRIAGAATVLLGCALALGLLCIPFRRAAG